MIEQVYTILDGTSLPKKSRRVSSYDTNCNKVAEGVGDYTNASCKLTIEAWVRRMAGPTLGAASVEGLLYGMAEAE